MLSWFRKKQKENLKPPSPKATSESFQAAAAGKGISPSSGPVQKPNPVLSQIYVEDMIPITAENVGHIAALLQKKIWMTGDEDLNALRRMYNPSSENAFERVDDVNAPFLTNGNKTRTYVWQRKDRPADGRSMVVLYADRLAAKGDDDAVIAFMPTTIWRGAGAPFVMIYRMSCCQALSALVSVGIRGENYHNVIDSPQGIKPDMGRLFQSVRVAMDEAGQKRLMDVYREVRAAGATRSMGERLPHLGVK